MFFDYDRQLLIWKERTPLDGVISKGDAYIFNKYNRGGTPVGGKKAESRNMNTEISVCGQKIAYGRILKILGLDGLAVRTAGRAHVSPTDCEGFVAVLDGIELEVVKEKWMAEAILDAAISRGM